MELTSAYNLLPEAKELDPVQLAKKKEKLETEKQVNTKLSDELKALDARIAEIKAEQESLNKMVCHAFPNSSIFKTSARDTCLI